MRDGFNKLYLLPLALVVFVVGGYYVFSRSSSIRAADEWRVFEASSPPEAAQIQPASIKVYITGAVSNPGVYEVSSDSRVTDAVAAAGGAASDAALDMINMSARISDEEHIIVPRIGDEPPAQARKSGSDAVNINTATSEQLQGLSGIGEVTAGKIIAYREDHGGFKTIDEIMNVDRIGEKTFEAIADYITVD